MQQKLLIYSELRNGKYLNKNTRHAQLDVFVQQIQDYYGLIHSFQNEVVRCLPKEVSARNSTGFLCLTKVIINFYLKGIFALLKETIRSPKGIFDLSKEIFSSLKEIFDLSKEIISSP